MVSLLLTLLRSLGVRSPTIVCTPRLWNAGVDELARRCAGERESGAFLLGTITRGTRRIREFLFYDDTDPACFANGIVEFDGSKFGLVWKYCRSRSMTVVADVHVHPFGCGQSSSDQHNPMIAEIGHHALILPHYARAARQPGEIGIYEYLGARQWHDRSASGRRVLRIGWWPQ
jgi:proteasome lid subunit RPN8/RPN11